MAAPPHANRWLRFRPLIAIAVAMAAGADGKLLAVAVAMVVGADGNRWPSHVGRWL